jgi:hypothetical protein
MLPGPAAPRSPAVSRSPGRGRQTVERLSTRVTTATSACFQLSNLGGAQRLSPRTSNLRRRALCPADVFHCPTNQRMESSDAGLGVLSLSQAAWVMR